MTGEIDPKARERAWLLGGLLLVALLILAGRLFQMQVLVREEYRAQADANRIRPERITALRGRIYDRSGIVLADSRPSFSVSVVPYQIPEGSVVLDRLGSLIGVEPQLLRERMRRGFSRPYEARQVLRDVDIATVSIVEERGYELPGVRIESEPVRRYPGGSLAAHVLGYVGEVSPEELLAASSGGSGLAAGVRVGRSGIEEEYDTRLRGKDGSRHVREDARGRSLGTLREIDPVPGKDVWLSIDSELQARAESLLAPFEAGAVVALDPQTGEVLVLASAPTFDPNLFAIWVPAAVWDSLAQSPVHPLLDRAVQAAFPPGSTFKPVTALTGLLDGTVGPGTRLLPCLGSYRFGRRVFRCWQEQGHGSLPLSGAITQSCDVFFYQIGAKMNLDRFAEVAAGFGLGRRTGIDLPDEKAGLIPSSRYMNERYGKSGWGPGYQLNHSIGQGEILSTPLQLARFYAALGTGFLVEPKLLLGTRSVEGLLLPQTVSAPKPILIPRSVLDPVRGGLVGAVQEPEGTGGAARVPGLTVAGKTGTAENPQGTEHAWFVAWAPAERPRITIAVLLERAGHGGSNAAPLAGELLRLYFARGGV